MPNTQLKILRPIEAEEQNTRLRYLQVGVIELLLRGVLKRHMREADKNEAHLYIGFARSKFGTSVHTLVRIISAPHTHMPSLI